MPNWPQCARRHRLHRTISGPQGAHHPACLLGLVPLPPLYWLLLAGMLLCYVVLTQLVKTRILRRFGQ
jgi:hypothetical protein